MNVDALWYARAESLPRRAALAPLWALGQAFGVGVAARRWMYRAGLLATARPPATVVSVGNLVAGGAGKTPVVLHVVERLLGAGRKVAVLSRGYGRDGGGAAVTVVSDGAGGPVLGAAEAGDEPALVARRAPGAAVLVGPRRSLLAEHACARLGADALVLDDGFQHLALARDLDIVVVDASAPFGNGHLLPRGPLRERPDALSRAQLVWLSRVNLAAPAELDSLRALARRATGRAPVESAYRAIDVFDASLSRSQGVAALEGKSVLLLAGVARPASFRATLEQLGAKVLGEAIFPDHHRYTAAELEAVLARARSLGCESVVCTEKDAVRLPADAPVCAVRIAVEIVAGGAELDALLGSLVREMPA